MALKQDYKDDIFPGTRLYQMIKNDNGTYSFVDVTQYTQEGDLFGANDINSTNQAINRLNNEVAISLPVSGWSSAAPYTQAVSVAGVTAADAPVIGIRIAEGTTAANVKLQNKAWGCVDRAVTGAGTVTFYCYNKKPAADFSVNIKGV